MKCTINNENMLVDLEGFEKLWSFKFGGHFEIPLAHIVNASFSLPKPTIREFRAPGSFFPGLIKAGTYYTGRGKEFWYVTRSRRSIVVLDLCSESYNRLVLGFSDNASVQNMLREHHVAVSAE